MTTTEAEVRRLMATDTGYDPAVWRRIAGELGWLGLAIPERFGGAGFGLAELAVVFEETGRALLPAPLFSTLALALTALLEAGDDAAAARYLPRIAAGELVATLALDEPGTDPAMSARHQNGGWVLDGTARFVLDGHVAGLILVSAAIDGSAHLFAVDVEDAPVGTVQRTPMATMDQTRKQAVVTFTAAPGQLVGEPGEGTAVVDRARDRGAVLLGAEQLGGAARCLEMAVGYAGTRVQFDRPIGSFQAVKHKCADMLIYVECMRSALFQALRDAEAGHADFPASVSTLQVIASEGFMQVAEETIHVHGGIGFTWEHPAQLYFKRAKTSEVLLGTPAHHRRRFARLCQLVP